MGEGGGDRIGEEATAAKHGAESQMASEEKGENRGDAAEPEKGEDHAERVHGAHVRREHVT